MDQSVSDIIIQNLYPESETINVTASSNDDWNITVWKLISRMAKFMSTYTMLFLHNPKADNLDGSQTDLFLCTFRCQNLILGFTQRS